MSVRPETAAAAFGRRPLRLLWRILLGASLHEIFTFSTVGALSKIAAAS
jgi:hypothetical protein